MKPEKQLYQWDVNQYLTGINPSAQYVDYPIDNEVIRLETDGTRCRIPDEVLQTYGGKTCYERYPDGTYRAYSFTVLYAPKPPEYVYTPEERTTFEALTARVDAAIDEINRRADSGEFTPKKGVDYFTNAEKAEMMESVSSGAIGEFRKVVDTATTEYNDNHNLKLDKYNANASEKLTEYNDNATEKLNAYNSNADNRVAEFNSHTEQIHTDISELKSDLGDIRKIEVGQNLLDEFNGQLGYLESNGTISTSTSYQVSDFIELEPNTDYCLTGFDKNVAFERIRKIILMYDESKNPDLSTYVNNKTDKSILFNSSNYKYVRVCYEKSSATRNTQLNKGTEKAYEPYYKKNKNKMVIGNETTFDNNVIPSSAIVEHSVTKTEPINHYDNSNAVVGFLNSIGDIDTTATNYKTSDYIPIKNGVSYTIYPYCRAYCLYDNNKEIQYYDNTEKKNPFSFVAEYDGYLRFSIIGTVESNTIEVTSSFEGEPSFKNQEGIDLSNTQMKSAQNMAYNQNVLYGKKWVVVGDSFTNGDDSYDDHISEGIYKGKRALYHYLIGNRNLMDIVHFAEGGKVMTCPSDIQYHNSFSDVDSPNNYTDIPSLNPDYITIWLGINDSKTEQGEVPIGTITLGTIDDNTVNTFYGAWNVVLRYLIANCPYAHIGVVISNGCTGTNFPNAIKEVCRKWGIAYLDLNGDYTIPLMHRVNGKSEVCEEAHNLRKSAFWVSDTNGHPNAHAQAYQSTFIENWLRSI